MTRSSYCSTSRRLIGANTLLSTEEMQEAIRRSLEESKRAAAVSKFFSVFQPYDPWKI